MMERYILKGHVAVAEPDLGKWMEWFHDRAKCRIVQIWTHGEVTISTVFLGMDHGLGNSTRPMLFETMFFGGPFDGEWHRCSTWEEAEEQHQSAIDDFRDAMCEGWEPKE